MYAEISCRRYYLGEKYSAAGAVYGAVAAGIIAVQGMIAETYR
jgi:hypothetical protein